MKIVIPIVENNLTGVETPYNRSLYEIGRKTILQHVIEQHITINGTDFIFVLNKQDVDAFHLDDVLRLIIPNAQIVVAEGKTAGSACSCVLAIDYLEADEPLIVAGGDQVLAVNLRQVVEKFVQNDWDGGVVCFDDVHPHWSYVRIDKDGFVTEAAEKMPISRNATTGFYYYKRAGDFTDAVFSMIRKKSLVNGKYYVCPAYNEMILQQRKIGTHHIDKNRYFNFSHPKGVELFSEYLKKGIGSDENN